MSGDKIDDSGIGLSFSSRMPLRWQRLDPDTDGFAAQRERLRNERLLQLLLLYDDYPIERRDGEGEQNSDLARLEAKLDAIIQLFATLIKGSEEEAPVRLVTISANYLEWEDRQLDGLALQDRLWILLQIDPRLPQPLKMAGSVVQITYVENSAAKIRVQLDKLGEFGQQALEKLIFRMHRREIALLRAQQTNPDH